MKEEILKAMKIAESQGYTIKAGLFYNQSSKCCCPLTAVCIAGDGAPTVCQANTILARACELLQIDETTGWSFVHGFDFATPASTASAAAQRAYYIGREVRNEWQRAREASA